MSPDEAEVDPDRSLCGLIGQGKRKRKKATRTERRQKKAAMAAADEDGGYTDKNRTAVRAEGGALATGGERTCLPDALWTLLKTARCIDVELKDVRSIMPENPDQNARFEVADKYVQQFNLKLTCITKLFKQKGGPALALWRTKGRMFIIQLMVTYDNADKNPDLHCVAYDGVEVKDNNKKSKCKVIDDTDRSSPEEARKLLSSLFPGLEVRVKNVYELA